MSVSCCCMVEGYIEAVSVLTLFANQTVIAVVGVVGVAQSASRVFEFEKLVTVSALMSSAVLRG